MFEDKSDFDFDDNILETCNIEEQENLIEKRRISEYSREHKKIKFDDICPTVFDSNNLFERDAPNKFVERKFPGPAGLMLNTCDKEDKLIPQTTLKRKLFNEQDEDMLCSQQTYSFYEEGPWKEMTSDFQIIGETPVYEKFNIQWIKLNSYKKKLLVNHKAPFLAAILDSLEIKDGKIPTINVTLKDKTGVLQGTVLYTLYKEYSDFFTVGSVLVLKQFGVLSIQNNHCITITPNNLLNIYHMKTDIKLINKVKEDCTKKIVVQQCTVQEIWQKYYETLSSHEQKYSNRTFLTCNSENSLNIPSKFVVSIPEVENNSKVLNAQKYFEKTVYEKNKFIFKKCTPDMSLSTKVLVDSDQNEAKCDTNCTRVLFKTNNEAHSEILRKVFEGVDSSTLFDDF